jgi:hypothetical protein
MPKGWGGHGSPDCAKVLSASCYKTPRGEFVQEIEMGTLLVTLDAKLERALDARGARESASRAELVRQALEQYLDPALAAPAATGSALERAGDLVGCFTGGPADLSANPRHLDDFGRV